MKRSKWMELPRKVVASSGAIGEIPDICAHLKLKGQAMIITGPNTRRIVGDEIATLLREGGFPAELRVTTESHPQEVRRAAAMAREIGAQVIIGAGGGRSIDIAKLTSLELDIPFISVPTAASHDGICSAQASLSVDGETKSVVAQAPLAIVADVSVIARAPHRLTAAGCGDIISNHTAILDWSLARRLRSEEYSEYAAALSKMTARMIMDLAPQLEPNSEKEAKVVVQALISSGVAMSIAGSSRPASGAEHMFAHAISRLAPGKALHGELCGLGTIIVMYLHGGNWTRIARSLERLGAPTCARQLDLDENTVVRALMEAHRVRPERYTILGNGLTREAAVHAAEVTGVI